MRFETPPQIPEITAATDPEAPGLVLQLPFDKGLRAWGRSWALRAEILSQMETGAPSLYRIAADYKVSRQYVGKLAKHAREALERKRQS